MSIELHIKNVCQSAFSEFCHINTIWHLLSVDSTKTLVSAFGLSRLDYWNSLLSGCRKHLLEKLQKVQNSSARLVLKAHKQDLMFRPSSELFTCCPSKHILSLSCQHCVTLFSLIHPLFICLTFSMSTVYQDISAPPLTQELYAFCCTLRPKHLDIAHFPIPLLLS